MKLHYAPLEASYSVCGRYCYNSTTLQFTADAGETDCLSCKAEIRRRDKVRENREGGKSWRGSS